MLLVIIAGSVLLLLIVTNFVMEKYRPGLVSGRHILFCCENWPHMSNYFRLESFPGYFRDMFRDSRSGLSGGKKTHRPVYVLETRPGPDMVGRAVSAKASSPNVFYYDYLHKINWEGNAAVKC